MSKPYKLVIVHWLDAYHTCGWHEPKEVEDPVETVSVGYVVKDTKDVLTIAQSVQDGVSMCGDFLAIPRAMVKSVRKVR